MNHMASLGPGPFAHALGERSLVNFRSTGSARRGCLCRLIRRCSRWDGIISAVGSLSGGQKAAEVALGLERAAEVRGVDGEEAIALWCRALYGDSAAYAVLLAYNRADVVMLEQLGTRLYERLASEVGLPPNDTGPNSRPSHVTPGVTAPPPGGTCISIRENRPAVSRPLNRIV